MVLDDSSADSEKKSLGYRRQGGGTQGDRAVVGRVKELVVGVSHQTAPCSGALWALRVRGGRRGEVSLCLPSSPPLHPLDWTRLEQRGGQVRGKQRARRDSGESDRKRENEETLNAPQAEDG